MIKRFAPWLRWVPLLLLVWLVGQFLEGPSYRAIVRSGLFMVMVTGVTLLACQAVYRLKNYPPLLGVIYTLITAGGFLWTIQHFYNGGKDSTYYWPLLFWSLFFLFNLLVYILSLFVSQRFWALLYSRGRKKSKSIRSYRLWLYAIKEDGSRGGIRYQAEGVKPLPETIVLSGYSQDQLIDLEPCWQQIEVQQLESLKKEELVCETIIKFGEALQLRERFELEIQVNYGEA